MIAIKIVTGSIRPGRFNIQPASWLHSIAQKRQDIHTELIDLEKIALPFHAEPAPPMSGKYTHEHTKKWSQTINAADGFVFITPEYNHSFSPVLKNALDYLYHEWNYKPVVFVSYGSLAGGSRAVEHLRTVAAELKMYDLKDQILFPNYWDNLDSQGNFTFTLEHEKQAISMLDSLTYWAQIMKDARTKLQR
jgi:NAD(P)H-dependent FMN reductase